MKKLLAYLLAAAAFLLSLGVQAADDSRVWVVFKAGQKGPVKTQIQNARGQIHYEFDDLRAIAVTLPTAALNGLRSNPNVELVEDDPRRYPLAQTMPYGITMVQADQVSGDSAGNTTVCIIDSGYYRAHEDLASGSNVTGSTDSGTGNWYVDSCGHGTHVAGTISALNNDGGVRGVLGSGLINIRAEKVFDGATCGWSYSSSLVAALNSCRNNATTLPRLVVNMSLGGAFSSTVESTAFQSAYDAGVLSVAAAGNDGNKRKSYPASYPSVISVAAVDSNKNVASFSQQNNQVELAAPGVGVLSTVPFVSSSVAVGGSIYPGENIDGSERTNATGELVNGFLCDSVGAWGTKIVLCQRGGGTFATKVSNVKNGGGAAAVIYNNVAGGFSGTLSGSSTIPAISISQEDGEALLGSKLGQSATVTNSGGAGSGYAYYDGTSMATPHVSGVAALVWSNAPTKTNAQVRAALQATAEDRGAFGLDNAYGHGIVRAKAALDYLASGPPPANNPPTASFAYVCTGLTCNFTDTSTDSDGTITAWNWTFGDASPSSTTQNPEHKYTVNGTYAVTLTVTDNGGATVSSSPQSVTVTASSGAISLAASGRKVKGVHTVELSWSGASGTNVDIYRNGENVATTTNDVPYTYTDSTGSKGSASYTYKVCAAGTATCSNTVQVNF